jgi:hypothetical protein
VTLARLLGPAARHGEQQLTVADKRQAPRSRHALSPQRGGEDQPDKKASSLLAA